MTVRPSAKATAVVASALLGAGLIVSAPAQAYPPGVPTDVEVSREVVPPGGKTRVVINDAQPECKVAVRVFNRKGVKKSVKKFFVNDEGTAATQVTLPGKPSRYRVRVSLYGLQGTCDKENFSYNVRVVH